MNTYAVFYGDCLWNSVLDYSKIPFNLGGRINLLYCFFWGFAAVIWMKAVYPFLSRQIERLPKKAGRIICSLLLVVLTADMRCHLPLWRVTENVRKEKKETGLSLKS